MNSRLTLAIALLLSSAPFASFASDRDCTTSDLKQMMCDCRDTNSRLAANTEFTKVAVGALVAKELLATSALPCAAQLSARVNKFLKKYVLNHLVFQDSIEVTLDLPSLGRTTVLNTDQFLEVLLVVLCDLSHKKAVGTVVVDGALTLAREEVVAAALWLLDQINVEALIPESVTEGVVYQEARTEAARFFADKAIASLR